jgi:Na+-translocating ferredoxin:NAD+ oxidoreductase RNF subunit RnfB
MSDEVKAYFCPKCESVNVGFVFRFGNLFGLMPRMQCRDCGFVAVSFPILVARKNGTRTNADGRGGKKVGKKVKKVAKRQVSKKKVAKKVKKVVKRK